MKDIIVTLSIRDEDHELVKELERQPHLWIITGRSALDNSTQEGVIALQAVNYNPDMRGMTKEEVFSAFRVLGDIQDGIGNALLRAVADRASLGIPPLGSSR